ncbi:hypothetical protein SAMN05216268_102366 [Streptomyces yunnanensis]|uniref:SH3 domain-containing protein n=1 Tax=Streptomyces yunnanensis TaxID=156453 RepID=A0A9X8QP57_9ACTN|nr:hypothetical protein SAMN05216268_102366 [Streptomyces yunnanensis]
MGPTEAWFAKRIGRALQSPPCVTSVKPGRYLGVTIEKSITAPFVAAVILAASVGTASFASADAGPKTPNFRMHTTPSAPYGTVLSRIGVNERRSPSTDSAITGSLGYGALVGLRCMAKAQEVEGNRFWFRLRGRHAWVPARYVKITGHAEWCEEAAGGTSSKDEAGDAFGKGADDTSSKGAEDTFGKGADDTSSKGAEDASGKGVDGTSSKGADATSGKDEAGDAFGKGAEDTSGKGADATSGKGVDGTSGKGADGTSVKRAADRQASGDESEVAY